ncbi:sugar transferase [Candidatus Neomarinimicrobiota bacterium]
MQIINPIRPKKSIVYRNWRYIFNAFAIFYDTAVVFSCGLVTATILNLYYSGPFLTTIPYILVTTFFWVIFLISSMMMGLYRVSFYIDVNYQFIIAAKAYLISCAFIFASFYTVRFVSIPRSFTLLFLFLLPLFFIVARNVLMGINLALRNWGLGVHNVLMIIDDQARVEDFYRFSWLHDLGYNVHGLISNNSNGELQANVPVFPNEKLREVICEYDIDRIFIPTTHFAVDNLSDIMAICAENNVKLKILAPRAIHLLQLAHIYDLAGFTLFTPPQPKFLFWFKKSLKRMFDFMGSLLLLVLLSPIFLLTTIVIYLESGSPVIYKQRRTAVKGGKVFNFYKFRSMIPNADDLKAELQQKNESTGALFKMKNDPRITRFGRFIRRLSIDELPQIYNVLIGDMSLVGPRPLPVEDIESVELGDGFWEAVKDRASVKPGITGLWQVSGRSDIMFDEMVLLDLYYVEYQSILLDLEIMAETVRTILFPKGAY